MAEEAPATSTTEQPKKKGKLFLIVGLAVVLLAGGGGAFLFLGGKKTVEKEAHTEDESPVLASFTIDTFIVNLSGSGNFLKIKIELEYDTKIIEKLSAAQVKASGSHGGGGSGISGGGGGGGGASGPPPLMAKRMPMVKDIIIELLSRKTGEEVLTATGRETLKQELVDGINDALAFDEPAVVAVYFIEFVVQ